MSERDASLAEIARTFLKIGSVSYGGPAIMGIMQTELQEKRQWLTKQRFVDGLSLVNMLPGPLATQLGIYIGHAKQGIAGGVIAGIGFIVPAFVIMLALSWAYDLLGSFAVARDSLYGVGPVVVGIFAVSVYRLAQGTIRNKLQVVICVAAMTLMLFTSVGLLVTLLAAGCIGIALFHSWRIGMLVLLGLLLIAALSVLAGDMGSTLDVLRGSAPASGKPTLWELCVFFLKVGALTFGGGLSMLAFIQDQVVSQYNWLTPQDFVDGLALGQFTPGPRADVGRFRRLQNCRHGRRGGRGWCDLPAVIHHDPVDPAIAAAYAEPGVAAGLYAGHRTGGDRFACGRVA
ncbi:MAG TPA: chromate efflux transporter [Ktedonobacterales bacterium]|nr:chromate efflux transporter [Ktedonobacterales bacterium]